MDPVLCCGNSGERIAQHIALQDALHSTAGGWVRVPVLGHVLKHVPRHVLKHMLVRHA